MHARQLPATAKPRPYIQYEAGSFQNPLEASEANNCTERRGRVGYSSMRVVVIVSILNEISIFGPTSLADIELRWLGTDESE